MEGLDPALGDYLLRWREEPSGETGEPGFVPSNTGSI